MTDGLPCSKCPLLDLGTKYPEKDLRDPWRRWPEHFAEAKRAFGPGMFNHSAALRLRIERLLGFYCRRQREAHGPCTGKRVKVCQRVTLEALRGSREGSTEGKRIAFAQAGLRRAINSDETHALLKATRIAPSTPDLRMPPITFKEVPAA